jgi:hypothetical protein
VINQVLFVLTLPDIDICYHNLLTDLSNIGALVSQVERRYTNEQANI